MHHTFSFLMCYDQGSDIIDRLGVVIGARFYILHVVWHGKAIDVQVDNKSGDPLLMAPGDTAYKRWSCHSGLKLLCKLCRTSPPPALGPDLLFFGHAGPLDGWRCCSQKRVMSRPIQVRQL